QTMRTLILFLLVFVVIGTYSCNKKCTNPEELSFTTEENKMFYYHNGDSLILISNRNDTLLFTFYDEKTTIVTYEDNCVSTPEKCISIKTSDANMPANVPDYYHVNELSIGHDIIYIKSLYPFYFAFNISFYFHNKYLGFTNNISPVEYFSHKTIDSVEYSNIYQYNNSVYTIYYSPDYGFIKLNYTDSVDTITFIPKQYW
ncbi:MAG: hypothetical protein L3J11_08015, partial [Draconibacterium sp.]|nr:hypothetical protein [Draconibacterium sp.]